MARKGKAVATVAEDVETQDGAAESPEEAAIQEGRGWYVIHTYSGYENKVKTNLEHRIQTMDAKDLIYQVVIPTEDEIEIRDGQRRTVDIEFMADMLDIEFGTGARICDHLRGGMRYHLTTPFCQTSKRSRVRNKSVMAPEHSNDITISAAYMLA